jgi:Anti-sigma-K factor rskA/Putative zinc-finger
VTTLRTIDCAEARERAPFFVLDALDARQAAEVREHLLTCAQPHPEFAELGGVVPYLAESVEPIDGGPELRRRVMDAIAADTRAAVRDDAAAERLIASFGGAPHAAQAAVPDTTATTASDAISAAVDSTASAAPATDRSPTTLWVDEPAGRPSTAAPISLADRARTRRTTPGWLLSAAAVLLIAVLGVWNVGLQQQASDAKQRESDLRTAVAVAAAPGARVARFSGGPTAPNVTGFAAFRPDGTGVMVLDGLSPAPSGRTYEAWFVAGTTARSAGLVRVGSDGLVVATGMTLGGPADAVALSIEPEGGSQQPSQAPFLVGSLAG